MTAVFFIILQLIGSTFTATLFHDFQYTFFSFFFFFWRALDKYISMSSLVSNAPWGALFETTVASNANIVTTVEAIGKF